MKLAYSLTLLSMTLVVAGCGPGTGFLIKPVPASEELKETALPSDAGPFVTDKIAVIEIEGLIMNARGGGMFGPSENPVASFVEKLDKAEKDPNVRAVVLRINSPGGGVTATDLMYRRLAAYKKERKVPVVAMIEDVGASGGYYMACGADAIVVVPTSVTGSIGVIVQMFSLAGTMEKLGITTKAVTSGPRKDMASPFKALDAEDEKVLQGLVTEFYDRFIEIVATGRPAIGRDGVKALADGRVYSGTQAVAKGLADSTGDMYDAVALAKKRAGLKTARIVAYERPWGYKSNVYSTAPIGGMQVNLLNVSAPNLMSWLEPQFLYLWTGGGGGQAAP